MEVEGFRLPKPLVRVRRRSRSSYTDPMRLFGCSLVTAILGSKPRRYGTCSVFVLLDQFVEDVISKTVNEKRRTIRVGREITISCEVRLSIDDSSHTVLNVSPNDIVVGVVE